MKEKSSFLVINPSFFIFLYNLCPQQYILHSCFCIMLEAARCFAFYIYYLLYKHTSIWLLSSHNLHFNLCIISYQSDMLQFTSYHPHIGNSRCFLFVSYQRKHCYEPLPPLLIQKKRKKKVNFNCQTLALKIVESADQSYCLAWKKKICIDT